MLHTRVCWAHSVACFQREVADKAVVCVPGFASGSGCRPWTARRASLPGLARRCSRQPNSPNRHAASSDLNGASAPLQHAFSADAVGPAEPPTPQLGWRSVALCVGCLVAWWWGSAIQPSSPFLSITVAAGLRVSEERR